MKVHELVAHLPVGPFTAAETRELDKLQAELMAKGIESVSDLEVYLRDITFSANREHKRNNYLMNRMDDEKKFGRSNTTMLSQLKQDLISSDNRLEHLNNLENQMTDLIHRKSQE